MEKMNAKIEHDLKDVVYEALPQDVQPEKDEPKGSCLFLYFAALTANLGIMTVGTSLAWLSPIISRLQLNDTEINPLGKAVDTFQISLIAGFPALGSIIGPLFFAKAVDIFGRKITLIGLSITSLVSTVTLAFSSHIYVYYVTRLLIGIATGAVLQALPIFLSEITEDHNRAKFGCLMGLFIPLGNLYSYILGPKFSIKNFTLICAVPIVINVVLFTLFVPDTPIYLASKGDKEGTIAALKKYRKKSAAAAEKDFNKIQHILRNSSKSKKPGIASLFKTRSLRKGLMVALGINLVQHFAGISAIMIFLVPVFDQAGTGLSGNTIAVLVGLVKIFIFFITSVAVERLGRRPLLLFSSAFSGIPLLLLGLYFYLQDAGSAYIHNILWLPVACIIVFIITYSLGLGPIPMAIMSEMFPANVKSVAVSFVMVCVSIAIFIISSGFPIAVKYIGTPWCFGLFGASCFLGSLFIYIVLPETKGKSVLEIQEILNR